MNELKITIEISDNVRSLGYALVNAILYPSEAEKQLNEVKKELLGTLSVLRDDHRGGESKIAKSIVKDPDVFVSENTGTKCSVCGEQQFTSPGGVTCKNGHGGADPAPEAEETSNKEDPVPEPKEEDETVTMEDVRALVVKSKANKEKAKEVMTGMGVRKLTDMEDGQLVELYTALSEGA